MASATFLRRAVATHPSCGAGEITVEQRTYAHATRPALLVTDVTINATGCPSSGGASTLWSLELRPRAGANFTDRADFNWTATPSTVRGGALYAGTTFGAERSGRLINAAVATVAPTTAAVTVAVVRGQVTTYSFPTAFLSDAASASTAAAVAVAADAALAAAIAAGPDALFAEHVAAVTATHADARIEIGGNLRLAQLLNATQHALFASLAAGSAFSTSPGGLSTGGRWTADGVDTHGGPGYPEGGSSYYGHVFWDADVWMLPGVLPFRPAVAAAMIRYRRDTMAAAVANAGAEHRNGTKWAWESAFSGVSATGGDCQEIHLQAGIAMALRQYYRVTLDRQFLTDTAWPMLTEIVAFFRSRATVLPDGTLALQKVQSPNEYARGIDNDIYTNSAFAAILEWSTAVASVLGKPDPGQYAALAALLVIPFDAAGGRHAEYTDAPENLRIKQATLTMVPFPVMRPMSAAVQKADLVYEAAHIGDEGPAMTHSMLAIDWLAIGNVSGGNAEFLKSFDTNVIGPYQQWMECPIPPDFCQGHRPATNFLTAAGGLMQAVVYGFGGVRYHDHNLTLAPTLISNTTLLSLRGLRWGSAVLDVAVTQPSFTVTLRSYGSGTSLCVGCATDSVPPTVITVGASATIQNPNVCAVTVCQ
jgi:hypothetical protein